VTPYENTVLNTFDILRQEHEDRGFALARKSPLWAELVHTRLIENLQLRLGDSIQDIGIVMGNLRAHGHL
jgi:hypothetical protein